MAELTQEQIEKMEAGPELDALVLERVCGWRWMQRKNAMPPYKLLVPPTVGHWVPANYKASEWEPARDGTLPFLDWSRAVINHNTSRVGIPSPSTSIADAWEVVEHLGKHDFWLSLEHKTIRDTSGDETAPLWFARFRCVRGATRGDHIAAANTTPLAIARAALLASLDQ